MRDFLYTLILLGSIQGIICCGLLLFSRGRSLSTRLLAIIIGLLTLPGLHLYFHYKGAYEINDLTRFIHDIIPMVVVMPIGPLIYFYVRSLTNPDFRINKREWIHFLPVIIDLLPKIAGLLFYTSAWLGYSMGTRSGVESIDDIYNQYADIPRWISLSVYIVLVARYLFHQREKHAATIKVYNWLRLFTNLFAGFQLLWLIYLIPYIVPAYSAGLLRAVDWFPLYIPMTILVYWVGIQGYITTVKLSVPRKINDSAWIDTAWEQLLHAMEKDRLYLDPTLNLEKVAIHTGLSERQISALLNQYRSLNFNAFINKYRIEEFKEKLASEEASQFTMAGLAMKCGFNSPATFQRIFKQFTGMAPTTFLKSNRKPSQGIENV